MMNHVNVFSQGMNRKLSLAEADGFSQFLTLNHDDLVRALVDPSTSTNTQQLWKQTDAFKDIQLNSNDLFQHALRFPTDPWSSQLVDLSLEAMDKSGRSTDGLQLMFKKGFLDAKYRHALEKAFEDPLSAEADDTISSYYLHMTEINKRTSNTAPPAPEKSMMRKFVKSLSEKFRRSKVQPVVLDQVSDEISEFLMTFNAMKLKKLKDASVSRPVDVVIENQECTITDSFGRGNHLGTLNHQKASFEFFSSKQRYLEAVEVVKSYGFSGILDNHNLIIVRLLPEGKILSTILKKERDSEMLAKLKASYEDLPKLFAERTSFQNYDINPSTVFVANDGTMIPLTLSQIGKITNNRGVGHYYSLQFAKRAYEMFLLRINALKMDSPEQLRLYISQLRRDHRTAEASKMTRMLRLLEGRVSNQNLAPSSQSSEIQVAGPSSQLFGNRPAASLSREASSLYMIVEPASRPPSQPGLPDS